MLFLLAQSLHPYPSSLALTEAIDARHKLGYDVLTVRGRCPA